MKVLLIGDPHVRPGNLDESDRLMAFASETAIKESVNRIFLLGDLNHTHAILRLEVVEFWDSWLDHMSDICETDVLVGNHDMSGDYHSDSHALSVFHRIKKSNLKIIDYPTVSGIFGFLSYVHDKQRFVEAANGLAADGARVLVCHTTFNGSKYENGFYAPDGIDPSAINIPLIISGHIHAQQEFDKVVYPGTPRWDTASDANQPKGIWIYTFDDQTGALLERKFYSSENVCSPILSFQWVEGTEAPTIPVGARASVELLGSSDFVAKAKLKLKGKASIKAKITDKAKLSNRKAGKNLKEFLLNFYMADMPSEKKERILKFLEGSGLV